MSISVLKKRISTGFNSGFTLVELLVVIAIIGVLATLVLLQLGTARAKARDTKRISDVNQIRSALELFADDRGGYPGPVGGDLDTTTAAIFSGVYFASGLVPHDPTSAADYAYISGGSATACAVGVADKTQYHVRAELERDGPALDTDSDIDSTLFVTGPCGTTINDSAGANEACTVAALDCQFDLGQR